MKPLSIADYLDHLGRAAGEKAPPGPDGLPFRPRTLASPQKGGPVSRPLFDRGANPDAPGTHGEEVPRRPVWAPKAVLLAERRSPPAVEPVKAEDIGVRLAEAFARGREEGLAEGRVEASESHTAELAAMREQAEMERQEFLLNQYAELEGALRSGLRQVEDNLGAATTHILAPFLAEQVVRRAADALTKAVARLCAGGSPGLIKISRTRAHACALARADRRSADRGRVCRGRWC